MNVIEPTFEIIHMPESTEIMRVLEIAARNCYKSEDKIKPGSAATLIRALIKSGHGSVVEHMGCSIRLICDRGVMAEITRHRVGVVYSIESTRYANYSKEKFGGEITVIRPFFWATNRGEYLIWKQTMEACERAYLRLLSVGATPQEARSVLPNSLKTDIVLTANMRAWRHLFNLRCSPKAHPQMVQSMLPVLAEFHHRVPVLFDDIYEEHKEGLIK